MATTEELFTSLNENESEEILTIDLDTRVITIPESITNIGVESDDDVRTLKFRMPQKYRDLDLSEFQVRINYMNANAESDVYEVKDTKATDGVITFSWEVGRYALQYKGDVNFIVCMKLNDDSGEVLRELNTTLATLPVLEGLETDAAVIAAHADLLEQWKSDLLISSEKVEQLDTILSNFVFVEEVGA